MKEKLSTGENMRATYNFLSFMRRAMLMAFEFGNELGVEVERSGAILLDSELEDRFDDWFEALVVDGDLTET